MGKLLARTKANILYWIAVVLLSTVFSFINTSVAVKNSEFHPIGGDIKNIIQMIQKTNDSTLFSRDFTFSDQSYKFYAPLYINIAIFMGSIIKSVNYDIILSYLLFPICFIFFISCVWLFNKISNLNIISIILALIATLSIEVIYGNLTYSVGIYVTPRFLHLAFAPALFAVLLLYGTHKIFGPIIFLITGLTANIHFGSGVAIVFAFWLSLLYIDLKNNKLKADYKHWVICGLAGVIGALPYLFSFFSGSNGKDILDNKISPVVFNSLVSSRLALYPIDIFSKQLQWSSWGMNLIHAILYVYIFMVIVHVILNILAKKRQAYFLLYYSNIFVILIAIADELMIIKLCVLIPLFIIGIYDLFFQEEIEQLKCILLYLTTCFILLGILFSLAIVDAVNILNLFIPVYYYDFGVAVKYIPLIINIYLVVSIKDIVFHIKKRAQQYRFHGIYSVLNKTVFALIIVTIIIRFMSTPYNGFSFYYTNIRNLLTSANNIQIPDKFIDYRNATGWVKVNTDKNSLFLVLVKDPPHDFMFRYKTMRSMWVCYKDGGMSFYKGRSKFIQWHKEYNERESVLLKKDPNVLLNYARGKRIDYIFYEKNSFPWLDNNKITFNNSNYSIIKVY